jgi:putative PIN family toxin of toxin-antitoxin system
MRAVIDTNILVSGLIRPRGAPGAILQALRDGRVVPLLSPAILEEIAAALSRPWLQEKYGVDEPAVETFLRFLVARGEIVEPRIEVRSCRDPHDDMFLEAAIAGSADRLVTGDDDLLEMGSYQGVAIVSARQLTGELEQA